MWETWLIWAVSGFGGSVIDENVRKNDFYGGRIDFVGACSMSSRLELRSPILGRFLCVLAIMACFGGFYGDLLYIIGFGNALGIV